MIKLETTQVVGWEAAIRGMRNSYNSWDKSDSGICSEYDDRNEIDCSDCPNKEMCPFDHNDIFIVGDEDLSLMKKLAKAGTDHRKFMRMITVYVDVAAPMYWWKEADTYKVGTVRNSCSTMHTITEKKFTIRDFSCEYLIPSNMATLDNLIADLNYLRDEYINYDVKNNFRIENDEQLVTKDVIWYNIIQLLPSSYNQRSTLMLNYEVLANIYHSRKDHKLDEWRTFCEWIESLPYSEIITGKE
jgi:hypothetical protein